jgi:hypothetical protein
MNTVLPILAQLSAPDYLWLAFLLLVAVALMQSLRFHRDRMAKRPHPWHHLHELGHRLQERITHRHP